MDALLKMSEFRLEAYVPLFARRGVANATRWNKSRRSHLDIGQGINLNRRLNSGGWRLYTECLMRRPSRLEVASCIGGRHGTPRTSSSGAFYLLSALPCGLDLGTPPIDPPSDERQ
jgi:hypothetical protein